MKRTPRRVSRRTVAILASAIIATVLVAIAFVLTKPRWVGEGDWAACAEIATVRPAEAAETAARQEGVRENVACPYVAGIVAGWSNVALGTNLEVREVECVARGEDRCVFESTDYIRFNDRR